MENKINIAELLKDCSKGMELDCVVFNNVVLSRIDLDSECDYPIRIETKDGCLMNLTKYGTYTNEEEAKCLIFPKGKTTWEGFVPPVEFKDGDILATNDGKFIAIIKKNGGKYYCCCHTNGTYFITDYSGWFDRFATEEEKQKLFDVIKATGYKWNAETNTLEKLIEPKFKIGDKITNGKISITIGYIDDEYYYEIGRNTANRLSIKNQDEWELVLNKFDITTLKPFDKVLVRDDENCTWRVDFYSHYESDTHYCYVCVGDGYKQCIPCNEETAHLVGTTNDCPYKYKTWKNE